MIRKSFLLSILLLSFACAHGYKGDERRPRTAEEVKVTNQIEQLAEESDAFVKQAPTDLSPSLSGFAENTVLLKNNSLRFGPGSLEARNSLDRVRFHAEQIDLVVTKDKHPELIASWQKIRGEIDSISKELGYRVGKSAY